MVTSHADRTSPVVRGKWILDNLLGTPPPPPPANVPPLNENPERGGKVLTHARADGGASRESGLRELPQADGSDRPRRSRTSTRSARGATRDGDTVTAGTPIDATASCSTAPRSTASSTLRQALLQQPEIFVGTVTEKLLTYALGRGLQPYDMPAVRAIVRDAAATGLSLLVAGAGHRQQHAVSDAHQGAGADTSGMQRESSADVDVSVHQGAASCSSPR